MRKDVIFCIAGIIGGAVGGFFGGKLLIKKKLEKEYEEKLADVAATLHGEDYILKSDAEKAAAAREDRAFYDGRNYQHKKDYEFIIKGKFPASIEVEIEDDDALEEVPPNEDPDNVYQVNPDQTATITQDAVHVGYKSTKDPKMLGKDPYDDSDPNTKFDTQDLYYYMESDKLVDEYGHPMNIHDTIGDKPERCGYLRGSGSLDDIWIRNYDHETDYLVHRKNCAVEDDFGTYYGDGMELDE